MEEIKYKKCSKCGEEKELIAEYWHKDKTHRDGFSTRCKECKKRKYQKNKKEILKKRKEYYLDNKEEISEKGKQYYLDNKEVILKRMKEYYNKNKEEIILYSRRYYKEYYPQNREKHLINTQKRRTLLRELPNTLTSEEYKQTLEYFDYSCAYCGCELDEDNHHMEHIVPVSKGGGTTQKNIIPSCESCNWSKNAKTLADFYRYSDDFSIEKLGQIAKHLAQFTDWVVSSDER